MCSRVEATPFVVEKLGAYVRGGLSKREVRMVDTHLADCGDCHAVYAELVDVNASLKGLVAPIFLGPAAADDLGAEHRAPAVAQPGSQRGQLLEPFEQQIRVAVEAVMQIVRGQDQADR